MQAKHQSRDDTRISATTVGIGGDWSSLPTFRLGDQQCIGSPNFLAVVFKKQEISQPVVTRMQYLASEFSKIFLGSYPRALTAEGGDPFPHPTPSPAQAPLCWDQTLVPLKFSAVVAPLDTHASMQYSYGLLVNLYRKCQT